MNATLSDEESEEEQELETEESYLSMTALYTDRICLQVNPLGVASGVATPGHNTIQKSVCLTAAVPNEEADDLDEEELTVESVQKLYEELYADWIQRNKINGLLSKENTDLKASVSRLEVLLTKRDLEMNTVKIDLEKANHTLARMNSSSRKLDSILQMGRESKAGLDTVKKSLKQVRVLKHQSLLEKTRTLLLNQRKTNIRNRKSKHKYQNKGDVTSSAITVSNQVILNHIVLNSDMTI